MSVLLFFKTRSHFLAQAGLKITGILILSLLRSEITGGKRNSTLNLDTFSLTLSDTLYIINAYVILVI